MNSTFEQRTKQKGIAGKIAMLLIVAATWIGLDQWSKSLFEGAIVGEVYGSLFGGLIDLRLVHNTGAAWGIFAGNTSALGIFSVAVCVFLLGFFVFNARSINVVQSFGIALIIAGGVGNAIDRFTQGYVTDFLQVTFIDFPVFNVADIGVTCGVVILLIGLVAAWVTDSGE